MKRSRVFRISIRSVLAAFLVFGGLEALIMGARDPLASGTIRLTNRLMSLKLAANNVAWIIFFAELIFGIVFLLLGLRIGSRISRPPQRSVGSTGGRSVS